MKGRTSGLRLRRQAPGIMITPGRRASAPRWNEMEKYEYENDLWYAGHCSTC